MHIKKKYFIQIVIQNNTYFNGGDNVKKNQVSETMLEVRDHHILFTHYFMIIFSFEEEFKYIISTYL